MYVSFLLLFSLCRNIPWILSNVSVTFDKIFNYLFTFLTSFSLTWPMNDPLSRRPTRPLSTGSSVNNLPFKSCTGLPCNQEFTCWIIRRETAIAIPFSPACIKALTSELLSAAFLTILSTFLACSSFSCRSFFSFESAGQIGERGMCCRSATSRNSASLIAGPCPTPNASSSRVSAKRSISW